MKGIHLICFPLVAVVMFLNYGCADYEIGLCFQEGLVPLTIILDT